MKPKIQIERRMFYLLIILLSISNILLIFWLLDGLILGTTAFDNFLENERITAINNFIILRYAGYISNSILLIAFLVNILTSKKQGVGYLFGIIWIILFIGILLVPYFSSGSLTENWIRLTIVIIWSFVFPLLIICIVKIMFNLRIKRQNYYYEKIKFYKGGK
ncbi:hypothetical protein [Mesomycoplasma molare]|uniref:Uncharacterized protein n=1 Tax=Mesomycoplasma molare TaxID=171288 RepID=A0ABY5TU47_9BACT|nr:hypothetical protein [Mesomycoplasma molare]UWD34188.1 hypothetical protein NX772_03840 [Mesomycoplasma molare]